MIKKKKEKFLTFQVGNKIYVVEMPKVFGMKHAVTTPEIRTLSKGTEEGYRKYLLRLLEQQDKEMYDECRSKQRK